MVEKFMADGASRMCTRRKLGRVGARMEPDWLFHPSHPVPVTLGSTVRGGRLLSLAHPALLAQVLLPVLTPTLW